MAVLTVISYFTIKRFLGSRTDDWIDKLNHAYTVTMLIVFGIVVSTGQFVGDPIHCWAPAEFTDAFVAYTKSYCWIKNTYYIPMTDVLPVDVKYRQFVGDPIHCWAPAEFTDAFVAYTKSYCWIKNTYYIPMTDELPVDVRYRQEEEITYYQWVPLILLFMAFMFKFPNLLWKIVNTHTGLNIAQISDMADKLLTSTREERENLTANIAEYMDKWLRSHHPYSANFITRAKSTASRYLCIICNKREGKFLTPVYICIKIMYVVIVIMQFTLLGMFLAMDYNSLGYEVLHKFSVGASWRESPRFPRVTMCDFQIRQLQNIQRFTVQCVLPINLFNEKIFIFLWFWFFILAILSTYNFAKWLYLLVLKKNNYTFVKKYLKIVKLVKNDQDKKICRQFANRYLRDDGCFVLRIIATNSTDMVVIELVKELFLNYKKREESILEREFDTNSKEKDEKENIPYIDSE